MEIIPELTRLGERAFPRVAAAVGTFDGVHAGHQRIIGTVLAQARRTKGTAAVFTFVNHPLEILQPDRAPKLITPYPLKERLLGTLGVDLLVAIPFTATFAQMEAETFVVEVLVKRLRVEFLCVGFDFTFGQRRQGTPDLLERMGRDLGFAVEVIPPVTVNGTVVKSALIRDLLRQGKVGEAVPYLTRPYAISGEVVPGAGRGKALGFATANLNPSRDFLIPDGVYAGRAYVAGKGHDAAINVGVAPTFGGGHRRIEAHLLDLDADRAPVYGQVIILSFWERLRDEVRFATPEELRAQVDRDIARTREILCQPPFPSAEDWALQT